MDGHTCMYVSECEGCKQCVCMLYVELGTFLGASLIHNSVQRCSSKRTTRGCVEGLCEPLLSKVKSGYSFEQVAVEVLREVPGRPHPWGEQSVQGRQGFTSLML